MMILQMSRIGRMRIPLLLFWFVVQVSLIHEHASSTPTYLYTYCRNNTTLFPATDSGYRTNINALLSTLSSSANRSSSPGFHYTNSTSSLTGLYLCRGDDEPASTCRECVAAANADLPNKCPIGIQAVIWYDECMVRYSNTSLFAQLDSSFSVLLWNTHNVTGNVTGFSEVLSTTLAKVVQEAGGNKVKFATEQANFAAFQNVYVLGQCTPDLSPGDCTQCLQQCSNQISSLTRQGGRLLYFSCNLRYEIYPFYHTTTAIAASSIGGKKSSSKVVLGSIVGAAALGLMLLAGLICLVLTKWDKKQADSAVADSSAIADFSTSESLQYGFDTLQVATNNFSDENKIGQGGFGHVYKGTLPNGRQVAVKRLLRSSGQAAREFKNEVTLVAKLQHRNLVRLLGFCVSEDDKLFVYEYIPNNSLDSFLFDPEKQQELDWSTRYKIISGIARGMLYLHEDSQLRIIHRDLKASNVLLDTDMTAKISDFGMARIFGEDETQGNTNRVVGTYGYMSPEYAMHGQFSVKSDVYSFGVVVLEIVSGKRNSNFYVSGYAEDLLSYAWKLWREGRPMEFVDATLRNSCSNSEAMRCIHIGLLCVQDEIEQRPTMASIVLMLNNHSVSLSAPLRPSYFAHKKTNDNVLTIKSTSKSGAMSVNEHL